MPFRNQMNTANKITLARIAMVPVFIAILYFDRYWTNIIATVIYTVTALTDLVDGHIARKHNMVTDLGKILDPVADKILVTAGLVLLVEMGRLEAVVVIILIGRDLLIGALRNVAASKGTVIAAGRGGKTKTVFQMIGVGMIIWKNELLGLDILLIGKVIVYVSVILSLHSGWEYYKNYQESETGTAETDNE
ncbi:MAG: CDP-diacylglycerol--glycerol-3-phosphate 3-phosphatidyltransferase [Denitrovibrio sp.]|nr:MAG: CDP-diacylglycerol--glycerol-3-phosphate 3-phosphatidyltransferase [Denitrovibrio sp.]